MAPWKRIALFAAGVAVVFTAALALGSAIDPVETKGEPHGGHGVEERAGQVSTAEFTVVVAR